MTSRRSSTSRVGIQDVARAAGVAPSSVSRVINNHPDVGDELRARVEASIRELGYQPNSVASSMRTGRTQTIGYIVRDFVNPLFSTIADAAERELSRRGYALMIMGSRESLDTERAHVRNLLARNVDALMLSATDERNDEMSRELDASGKRVLLLDRDIDTISNRVSIHFDRTGLHDATRRLIDLGHRDIAMIGPATRTRPSRQREGTLVAFREAGELDDLRIVTGDATVESAHAMTAKLFDGSTHPTALIVASNQLLVGAVAALRERGLDVPGDVSLVAHDRLPYEAAFGLDFACVERPIEEMGSLAASLAIGPESDIPASREVLLPTTFHEGSTISEPRKGTRRS